MLEPSKSRRALEVVDVDDEVLELVDVDDEVLDEVGVGELVLVERRCWSLRRSREDAGSSLTSDDEVLELVDVDDGVLDEVGVGELVLVEEEVLENVDVGRTCWNWSTSTTRCRRGRRAGRRVDGFAHGGRQSYGAARTGASGVVPPQA